MIAEPVDREAAAAALARLTTWERNFLRLYARGGLEAVRVELGSLTGRQSADERYGRIRDQGDADRVVSMIRAKLATIAEAVPVEPPEPPPERPPLRVVPDPPAPPPPPPAPMPPPPPPRESDPTEPEVVEPAAEPDPEPAPVTDDFGRTAPTEFIDMGGGRKWLPIAPVECEDCGRTFWPTHPRQSYCEDHRDVRKRPRKRTPKPAADVAAPSGAAEGFDVVGAWQRVEFAATVDCLVADVAALKRRDEERDEDLDELAQHVEDLDGALEEARDELDRVVRERDDLRDTVDLLAAVVIVGGDHSVEWTPAARGEARDVLAAAVERHRRHALLGADQDDRPVADVVEELETPGWIT